MDITVRHLEGVQFELEARGHRVICDQPVAGGGLDTGLTPPELLLASLGACAAYYALQYLRTRSLSVAGLTATVSAEKAMLPARLDRFQITVNAPELSGARHIDGVRSSVEHCLIHNTLLHPPSLQVRVNGKTEETISSAFGSRPEIAA